MERRSRGSPAIFLAILIFASVPSFAIADTVIRSDSIELFPEGSFENASEWSISTQHGFTQGVSAHWTQAMVTDSHLSFTHSRPRNIDQYTSWSSFSTTNSNESVGAPDGGYTWSKGPEIELSGFSFTDHYNKPLLNGKITG